jgi:uncharacterized protein YggE
MTRMLLVVVAAALAVASCSDGNSGQTTVELRESAESGISVIGVGEVFGAPDTMTLSIGVRVTEESVDEATAQAAESTKAVIDALQEAGVAEEDIQTQQFRIRPEYNFVDDRQELIGFTVTNTVVAKLRDIEQAGQTIDAAVAAGGDDTVVDGVGFSLEDDAERIAAARERAWDDAEAKAEQLADLAGITLGPAVQIAEGFDTAVPGGGFEQMADARAVNTPIEPGQVASTVTVSVRFSVEP